MSSSICFCSQLLEVKSGRQMSCWQHSCAQGKFTCYIFFGFIHLSHFCIEFLPWSDMLLCISLYFALQAAFIPFTCILFLCVIVFCPMSSVVLCLQTSSWWTWSFGWRAPQQLSPLALWWPFWLCGLESLCPSPSLVPTLDSRKLWVRQSSFV